MIRLNWPVQHDGTEYGKGREISLPANVEEHLVLVCGAAVYVDPKPLAEPLAEEPPAGPPEQPTTKKRRR